MSANTGATMKESLMSEHQNIETLRRGYELFGRGDIEGLLGLFDPNIEWVSPGPAELPTSGHRRGHQQVREFFNAVNETFDIQKFEPTEFIAQGDRVVVLGQETASIRATGKTITETWAHAFRLRDGKVVSFTEYLDTSATVAELRAAHAGA
jgi:ketosteroid isomerase-like protein